MAHYSKKSTLNSDIDFFDESEGEAIIFECYVSRSGKKSFRPRRFKSKLDSSASKDYNVGKKSTKEGSQCFNYGGVDHFLKECKSKRVNTSEYYKVTYKKLLAFLKRKNIDVKILVAEVENWVDDEESSNEDKCNDNCLMERTDATIIDEGSSKIELF